MKDAVKNRRLLLAIAALGLFTALAFWLYESLYGPSFCILGEHIQDLQTRWEWPTQKGQRNRDELLRDEIACMCTQGPPGVPTECESDYPIKPGTSVQRLEEMADYYSHIGSQEPKEKCMAKKGYEPVLHKQWICYSRWSP